MHMIQIIIWIINNNNNKLKKPIIVMQHLKPADILIYLLWIQQDESYKNKYVNTN